MTREGDSCVSHKKIDTNEMVLRRRQPTRPRSPKSTKEGGGKQETAQGKRGFIGEKKGSVSLDLILDHDWQKYRIHRLL